MIWTTDAQGRSTHISNEIGQLTGRGVDQLIGDRWVELVHPDDRDAVGGIFATAVKGQQSFLVRYRFQIADGTYAWVISGAVPSFGPPDHTFLGFHGSLSKLTPASDATLKAYGTVGAYEPPQMRAMGAGDAALDLVADYMLLARAVAVEHGADPSVRSAIDLALTILVVKSLGEKPDGRYVN